MAQCQVQKLNGPWPRRCSNYARFDPYTRETKPDGQRLCGLHLKARERGRVVAVFTEAEWQKRWEQKVGL